MGEMNLNSERDFSFLILTQIEYFFSKFDIEN